MSEKSVDYMALSLIYQYLPEKVKKRVIIDILSRNGFQVKLKDFRTPRIHKQYLTRAIAMPIYFRCSLCNKDLFICSDPTPTEDEKKKALMVHLPSCTVFMAIRQVWVDLKKKKR